MLALQHLLIASYSEAVVNPYNISWSNNSIMIRLEVSYRSINFYIFFIPLLIFIYADSSKATEITYQSSKISTNELCVPKRPRNQTGMIENFMYAFSYILSPLEKVQNLWNKIKRKVTGAPRSKVQSPLNREYKKCKEYKDKNVAVVAFQGHTNLMLDRFYIDEDFGNTGVSIYAIFDGHTIGFAVTYVIEHLMKSLKDKIIKLKGGNDLDENLIKYMKNGSIEYTILLKDEILDVEEKLLKELKQRRDNYVASVRKTDDDENERLSRRINIRSEETGMFYSTFERKKVRFFSDESPFNYETFLNDKTVDENERLSRRIRISSEETGTTALIALIDGEKLFVANVGDSRGVMIYNNKRKYLNLSNDHKVPFSKATRIDIRNEDVNVTRTLGDLRGKLEGHLTADPDTYSFDLNEYKPEFIILATDGLWSNFSSEQTLEYINDNLDENLYGAKDMVIKAYEKGSSDDITVLIVKTR